MKNILLLNHHYEKFGTYWRIWFLARGLAKLGNRVTLATVSRKSEWETQIIQEDGVRIWAGPHFWHDLPGHGTGPLDILARKKIIRKNQYDVIHGFEFHPNVRFPMYVGMKKKHPIIISDWCDWYSEAGLGPFWGRYKWVKKLIGYQEDEIRKRVHGVTAISHLLEERTRKIVEKKIPVLYLPGGAPVDVIKAENKGKSRIRWKIAPDQKVVGFVGTNQKDLDILVQAFLKVASKEPRCLLFLIGSDNHEAKMILSKKGLGKNIRVTGQFEYSDLSSLMGCCDVFGLPLRDTIGNAARWPNKIGEYLSASRPTVASNVGEMKLFFQKYKIGKACSNEPELFAQELLVYLRNSKISENVGKEARKIAETVLPWDLLSNQLNMFYEKIIETRS